MALLERLQRKAVDYGLTHKIIAQLRLLSTICVCIGLTVFMSLPLEGQYRRTYISENALMPSQAYSYFRESEWNILRGYRAAVEELTEVDVQNRHSSLASWLDEFGVKSALYIDEVNGDTLYGVYRTPRGDDTEAIVLAVPWVTADDNINIGGTALGLSLVRFFSRWPVWSKNIIVVFSENPNKALKSWVQAYHTSLDLTGGSISTAIVVDYAGTNDYFDHVEIHYDGLNGELPNLDLVNIAVSISEHEGMKVSLHGIPTSEFTNTYWSRLKTLCLGTKNLFLSGARTVRGNEVFGGWKIQSLTLKACGDGGGHDITTFGRIVEAIFRSVNNLLEKFHQSFFFYFLLAPRYFISIASYLPCAVAVSVAFSLASLNAYMNNRYSPLPFLSSFNLEAFFGLFASIFLSFIVAQLFLAIPKANILILLSIIAALIPLVPPTKLAIKDVLSYRLKVLAYLYMSLVLTSLLVVNFALSFGMGLLCFPLTFVETKSGSRLKNVILLLCTNPFIALCLFTTLFDDELKGTTVLPHLAAAWHTLGSLSWFVICIGWLPTWILVAVSSAPATPVTLHSDDKKNI